MAEIVPGRSARLAQVKEKLVALRGRSARIVCELGRCLLEVQRDELWREDEATSFNAWLEEPAGLTRQTAYKAMRVAEHFTPEMAERFGIEKLSATVRYIEATGVEEQPGDVLALSIRVRGPSGTFRSIPFAEASYREITEAARLVEAARRGRSQGRVTEAVERRVEALQAALPAAPKGTVRRERVRVVRGRDGRLALTLKAIPVDELEAVIAVLREHLDGMGEVPTGEGGE